MTKTMTYAEAIDNAIALFSQGGQVDAEDKETVERLEALKAQLAKRGSKGGLTKTQKLNEEIKAVLLDILGEAGEFIIMADIREDERVAEYSVQKVGALLGQLVKAGEVQKNVFKKRIFYAVKGVDFVAPETVADDEAEAEAE